MLRANQEKEMDDHTFEHEYFHVSEDLRWNLIQNKISEEQQISISEEEVRDLSRQMMRQQFANYGYYEMEPEKLEDVSNRYLSEEGNYEKVERILRENKVFDHLKKEVKLDITALPYDEFTARLTEKTQHELEHNH
jgi:trigger factor